MSDIRDEREPTRCPRCGVLCTYDGWDHVHPSGIGIGSCQACLEASIPQEWVDKAVQAYLYEQGWSGTVDKPERNVRAILAAVLADAQAKAWGEGYGAGVHDWQQSLDLTGGQTAPARVNPYIAREVGER